MAYHIGTQDLGHQASFSLLALLLSTYQAHSPLFLQNGFIHVARMQVAKCFRLVKLVNSANKRTLSLKSRNSGQGSNWPSRGQVLHQLGYFLLHDRENLNNLLLYIFLT